MDQTHGPNRFVPMFASRAGHKDWGEFGIDLSDLKVCLIHRHAEPFSGYWVL